MRHMLRPHVGARPSTLSAYAHWKLNELVIGSAIDSVGAYTLTATGSPGLAASLFAVPPGSTGARTFNGTTQFFQYFTNSATLAAALANEGAVSLVFQADVLSGTKALFTYEGLTASSAQAENKIISIYLFGDEIKIQWEYGSGSVVDSTTTGAGLSTGEPYLLVVSWSGATTKTLNVYVFDGTGILFFEQSFSSLTSANGGANADFTMGRGRDNTLYFDGTMDDVVLWKYPLTRDAAILLAGETFGISYDEETLYQSATESHHIRVRVANSAGTLVDLTSIAHGQDAIVGADVQDDIDAPGAQATITIRREFDSEENPAGAARWSLARDITESPLNTVGGSFSPLLTINRRVLIDTAVIPEDSTPREYDWVPLFEGYIGAVDWGADEISVDCADKISPLFDTFIGKAPASITSIDDTGTGNTLEIETGSPTGLAVGDTIKVYNTTNFNGSYTIATISGVDITTVEAVAGSPAAESSGLLFGPDVATYGSTLGTPVETVIQNIIDGNAPPTVGYTGGSPTLYTPTSPSFDIQPYYQQREPVQTAIENLALMIGWACRYLWDTEIRTFRLTLFQPERNKASFDYEFSSEEILDVSRASIDGKDIRNVVELTFSDSESPADGAGQYPRVTIRKEDATSISSYGYRLCQIAEASTSQIDTFAEASDLADAILSDLSEPKAEITIELPFRRFVELGDLYRLPRDDYHWDQQKDVAVVGYSHSFSDGRASTSLTLRGKPAAATKGWAIRMVSPGLAPNQLTTPPITPTGPSLTALSGGVEISSPWPLGDLRGRHIDQMEVHKSTTSGFLPNASTFVETIRSNRQDLHGLDPATTYYLRTRYRDKFGNFSVWSPQATVTPRYMLRIPAARAYLATSDQYLSAAGTHTLLLNGEDFDERGNYGYDGAKYVFTAPVSGVYSVLCHVAVDFVSKSNQDAQIKLVKNGTPTVISTGTNVKGDDQINIAHPQLNTMVHLYAGDDIFMQATVSTDCYIRFAATAAASSTFFSIALVSQDD